MILAASALAAAMRSAAARSAASRALVPSAAARDRAAAAAFVAASCSAAAAPARACAAAPDAFATAVASDCNAARFFPHVFARLRLASFRLLALRLGASSRLLQRLDLFRRRGLARALKSQSFQRRRQFGLLRRQRRLPER